MYLPEYTITSNTLKNIAAIEYAKAIIENTTVLPSWEKQLKKEARTSTIIAFLKGIGVNSTLQRIKRVVDNVESTSSKEINNIIAALDLSDEIAKNKDFEEMDLKFIHERLAQKILPNVKQGTYRGKYISGKTPSEEILARIVQLFDWYNSLDAKESHPMITVAILKASLEMVQPFEDYNEIASDIAVQTCLKSLGYGLKSTVSMESYYQKTQIEYKRHADILGPQNVDLTRWVEYFTEGMSTEAANAQEKVKLLARDTKVAKATGRVKLTGRQERIVEYLQDYGILQNKDFASVFPEVSEDTVLRDLKVLIGKEIVAKRGKTKSSRYELA